VAALRPDEELLADKELLVAAAPVIHPSGNRIGTAYVAFRRDHVEAVIVAARREQLLVVAAVLALGLVVVPLGVSALLRPIRVLREGLERIGRGDLETRLELHDRTELGVLAETVNEMTTRLREAQNERIDRERLAHEVELAREIQASLLPAGGLKAGRFEIQGSHRAAAEVGGDFYDAFLLDGGRVGLAVADVSGKGLAGCLVASMLAALLRAYRGEMTSPRELLLRLDATLQGSLRPGTFVTMFYGILEPASGRLVFASAGHSPLLVHRAAGPTEFFRTRGIPIGAVRNALARTLTDETVVLAPGDVCVQFTDGVNEAFDPSGERQFGMDRLASAVAGARGSVGEILARIRRDVDAWVQGQPSLDDETLLVVASAPGSPDETPRDPTALLAEARRRGHGLVLRAHLDALAPLGEWLASCPGLERLAARDVTLLESGLYELCANIAEHGYGPDDRQSLEVWWLPDRAASGNRPSGVFALVDQGRRFSPGESGVDFRQPAVRRRGRGIGLEIVRATMRQVSYHPATSAGNVTIVVFDPSKLRTEEEAPHG
jgi:serine phosphatase RsbU (regulator of sigma subunit)/anti-sigma regulatory factor (Ser/Thr protein kinase)